MPHPSPARLLSRTSLPAVLALSVALTGLVVLPASAAPVRAHAAMAAPTGSAGWTVVETPVQPRQHPLTIALVAPQGTEPNFTVADARSAAMATASYFSRETDGALTVTIEDVQDWRRMPDATPCSWSGALLDWVAPQVGWSRGDRRHLTVMVPTGEPCPGWANGEQGSWPGAGGRTYQPGFDPDTLIHELGHNMSVAHAFSIRCESAWDFSTVGSGVPSGCSRQEYGNQLDVMGGAWWMLAPFSSPHLDRLGMLPRRFEPQCGTARRLSVAATGDGAAARTAISWVDPTDPGARYWVDFRAVDDARRYKDLVDLPWGFTPTRPGLQILRTDPEVPIGTTVLERPGDTSSMRQLTDTGERVELHGGASVMLESVAADGATGVVEVVVPCVGGAADTTAPELALSTSPAAPDGDAAWFTSPVTFSAVASDDSGVAPIVEVSTDGGRTFSPWTAPPAPTAGSLAVIARATDRAGNVTTVDRAVQVDTVAPTVAGTTDPTARTVTLTGTDADPGSGVVALEHRVAGGAWTRVAGSVVTVPVGPAATTVTYRASDVAGNVSATGTVTLPAVSAATVSLASAAAPSATGWYRQAVTVAIAVPVGMRGQYQLDGGDWKAAGRPFTVSVDGTHTVATRLTRDAVVVVGSATSTTVKIDRTRPITTATRTSATGTPRNPVTVGFTATDATSGVAGTEYRVGDGPWTPIAPGRSVTVDTVGGWVIGHRSTDAAGNVESIRTVSVRITADPTTSLRTATTSVRAGDPVTFRLTGYHRGVTVSLTLRSVVLGSTVTGVDGAGGVTVRIPADAPAGATSVTAVGGSLTANARITVRR